MGERILFLDRFVRLYEKHGNKALVGAFGGVKSGAIIKTKGAEDVEILRTDDTEMEFVQLLRIQNSGEFPNQWIPVSDLPSYW